MESCFQPKILDDCRVLAGLFIKPPDQKQGHLLENPQLFKSAGAEPPLKSKNTNKPLNDAGF